MMKSFGHKIGFISSEDKATPQQWSASRRADPDRPVRHPDTEPGGVDTVDFIYLATHGKTEGHELQLKNGDTKYIHHFWATFDNPVECNWVDRKEQIHDKWVDKDGADQRIKHCVISTLKRAWAPKDDKNPGGPGEWVLQKPTSPTPMLVLGDGCLRWAVIDACRSLQVRLENDNKRHTSWDTSENEPEQDFVNRTKQLIDARPDVTWRWCLDGVHMLFGFTGLCSDAGWTAKRGTSFGQRAGRGEALADSWIDEAYSWREDDVPVVLACGRSGTHAEQRLMTESLAAVAPTLRASEIGGYAYMWRS
jgi:hypothetical protein